MPAPRVAKPALVIMSELVCPLDHRYGRDEMRSLFSERARLDRLLAVEAALVMAHADLGDVPVEAAEAIHHVAVKEKDKVRLERVKQIEAEIRHDLMAVVRALTEQCGDAGRWVHLGATSYDIIDTANGMQMRDAMRLLRDGLRDLGSALARLAAEHRDTVCLGRTHGQMATPVTFGLKMSVFLAETVRHMERIDEVLPRIAVGKMTGPVGSGAGLGDKAIAVQDNVMKRLELTADPASTQIVGRDRYVEALGLLAGIATSLEKFATEIRNLQRSEIDEVREGFDVKKQVGSSAMPHKQNPILSEQVSGLSRIVRAQLVPAMENAVQWHERDLANSSSERFIIPHAFLLTDWIIHQMTTVFRELRVFPHNMQRNLDRSKGLPLAERYVSELTRAGLGRQDAHEAVRAAAMRAIESDSDLAGELVKDKAVTKWLDEKRIRSLQDPAGYTGISGDVVDRVLALAREMDIR
jgi:adenylosuccinate lyase